MGYNYRRIDVDAHIQEKADTWTSRMSKAKWGDRIPHLAEVDGKEQWVINGKPTGYLTTCPAVMPDRIPPTRWEEIPKGVYEATERMKFMDIDGVDAEVLYANVSGVSGERFTQTDPDFEEDCIRAYNDGLTEDWIGVNPKRFVALTIPPYSEMERTLGEITRCAKNGHRGVLLYGTPHTRGMPNYSDPYWDPLWNTVQDLGVIITMHGSGAAPVSMRIEHMAGTEERRAHAASVAAGFSIQPQYFANFLFAGVLDRYPDLTFVGAESGIGWLPWLLESCDHAWQQGELWNHGLPTKPSDLFKQHCYVDFWYEVSAIQEYRHVIGVDRILWETDFPHPTSLFPETETFLAESFKGVPEEEQRQILSENPKRVYKLD